MKTKLLPTQLEDVDRIASSVDLPNYSEPGTGKTLTTIGAIERLGLQNGLVVCPTVATAMWQRIIEAELGARVQWLKTRSMKVDKTADFFVASYAVIGAHADSMKEADTDALVIDESHYCKSADAKRTQVIFGQLCDGVGGIYQNSEQCFTLTGTPIERYADDLWSQLRATQPTTLQEFNALSLEQFRRQFCRMEVKSYGNGAVTKRVSVGNQNEKLLSSMIYKRIGAIRRTIEEVDPYMPETTFRYVTTPASLTPELRDLLKGLTLEQTIKLLVENDDKMAVARRLLGVGKVPNVVNYITDIARHKQVLVGFWHKEVGEKLYLSLNAAKYPTQLIYGATSPSARERMREAFIAGSTQVLVGQIASMGVAMDGLQSAAHHVVFGELDWSASKMEQFYKRLARKGQAKTTQVDYCLADSLIDEALLAVSQRKESSTNIIHLR